MRCRFFNLLFLLVCSTTSMHAQITTTYVLSCLGSHGHTGNIGLAATLGQPFAAKLAAGSSVLTVGFQQPQIQINTDSLPVSDICNQQSINVPYQAWGFIDTSNQFTAQLSDAEGNFTNVQAIGVTTGTTSGFITAAIPPSLHAATGYKIRVVSSEPRLNGKVNPEPLSAGSCDSSQTGVGLIEKNGLPGFSCYPNPGSGVVYFSFSKNVTGKITLYDMNGRNVMEVPCNGYTTQQVDIGNLAQGIYLATYKDEESVMTTKIVKQ